MGPRKSGRGVFWWPRYPIGEMAIGILSFWAVTWSCGLVNFLEMAFASAGFISSCGRTEGIYECFCLCRSSLFSSLDVF